MQKTIDKLREAFNHKKGKKEGQTAENVDMREEDEEKKMGKEDVDMTDEEEEKNL